MDLNSSVFFSPSIQEFSVYFLDSLKQIEKISSEIIIDSDESLTKKIEGFDSNEETYGVKFYSQGDQENLIKQFILVQENVETAQLELFPKSSFGVISRLKNLVEELKDDLYYDHITLDEMGALIPEIKIHLINLLKMCFEKDNNEYKKWSENKNYTLHPNEEILKYLSKLNK
tara:strand:- start:1747 stop:2265 length:519 start_codon:yes stop_codon:yes gene_type:complete